MRKRPLTLLLIGHPKKVASSKWLLLTLGGHGFGTVSTSALSVGK
jgi:hypothetical protein